MSYADVTSSINTMKTQTNAVNYEKNKASNNNELGQDVFLQLMITQLQNQDPLDPMDNSEFLSQQAMFTQVNTLQEMNENLTSYGDALLSMNEISLPLPAFLCHACHGILRWLEMRYQRNPGMGRTSESSSKLCDLR